MSWNRFYLSWGPLNNKSITPTPTSCCLTKFWYCLQYSTPKTTTKSTNSGIQSQFCCTAQLQSLGARHSYNLHGIAYYFKRKSKTYLWKFLWERLELIVKGSGPKIEDEMKIVHPFSHFCHFLPICLPHVHDKQVQLAGTMFPKKHLC